jgi:hypothetical protein
MKVKTLIEELRKFDPNEEIYVEHGARVIRARRKGLKACIEYEQIWCGNGILDLVVKSDRYGTRISN